jgi:hypothetical protein
MAQQNRTTLKGYFNTGDVPTEAQFADLIDSFHNPSNDGAVATLTGTQELTNKTLTSPTVNTPAISGTVTGTFTLPATTTFPSQVALLTGTQELINKTISGSSNTITNVVAANVNITDGGNLITATTVEGALAELAAEIDLNASNIASFNSSKITRDQLMVYTRDFETNADDAREVDIDETPVVLEPGDTVIWRGYATRPTNMGTNDIWLGPPGVAVTDIADTTYTLVLNDGGTEKHTTSGSATTVTIPADATTNFPLGTTIVVTQTGAGVLTVQGATGVTVNGTSAGSVACAARYQGLKLTKRATNVWIVSGAIA